MKKLLDEAKKLGIATTKKVYLEINGSFCFNSTKELINKIDSFVKNNNIEDATWEIKAIERYGDTETSLVISSYINKTEEELQEEINKVTKKFESEKERKRKLYEQLKVEFGE